MEHGRNVSTQPNICAHVPSRRRNTCSRSMHGLCMHSSTRARVLLAGSAQVHNAAHGKMREVCDLGTHAHMRAHLLCASEED